jgi:hypothetical protein
MSIHNHKTFINQENSIKKWYVFLNMSFGTFFFIKVTLEAISESPFERLGIKAREK